MNFKEYYKPTKSKIIVTLMILSIPAFFIFASSKISEVGYDIFSIIILMIFSLFLGIFLFPVGNLGFASILYYFFVYSIACWIGPKIIRSIMANEKIRITLEKHGNSYKQIIKKSLLIKIGIVFFIVDIILFILLLTNLSSNAALYFFYWYAIPLFFISMILIFAGLFTRAVGIKKYILGFLILVLLYGTYNYQFPLTGFSLEQSLAIETKNGFFCSIILFSAMRDSCYEELGILRQDIHYCKKIKEDIHRDNCYERVAATTGNIYICEELMSDQYSKDICYHKIAKKREDPSFCDKIKGWPKDPCYVDLAKILKDESICEKIEKPESIGFIRNGCFRDLAKMKNDPSICEKIIESNISITRQSCYEQFK